jgi:3-oxoadipate enol-lactonase
MWDPQWPILAERHDVVRCDLRGSGDSHLPAERYNDADDVRRLLDHLDIARTDVVGASFGGLVALDLASRWPERVANLVLLSPAWNGIDPDAELRRFAAEEDAHLAAGDLDGAVELNVTTWLGPDASPEARDLLGRMQRRAFEVQLAAGDDAIADDMDPDPAAITAATLVVSGVHDLTHFSTVAVALADRIPRAEHRQLDWAGHLPSLERPADVGELLIEHLR